MHEHVLVHLSCRIVDLGPEVVLLRRNVWSRGRPIAAIQVRLPKYHPSPETAGNQFPPHAHVAGELLIGRAVPLPTQEGRNVVVLCKCHRSNRRRAAGIPAALCVDIVEFVDFVDRGVRGSVVVQARSGQEG